MHACVHAKSVASDFCDPMDYSLLSTGFSRKEYWNGFPCPPSGDLPNPGIKPRSPALQVVSLLSEPAGKPNMPIY